MGAELQKGHKDLSHASRRLRPGDCQCIEIRSGKHGIQSILIFLHATVTGFPVPKLSFNNSEHVLCFTADGGFALSDAARPVDCMVAHFGKPAGAEIDAVIIFEAAAHPPGKRIAVHQVQRFLSVSVLLRPCLQPVTYGAFSQQPEFW